MKHFSESERNRCREVEIGTSLQFNLMKDSSACLLDLDKFPGHSCLSQGTVMINPASTNHDSLLFRVAAPGHGQPPPGYNWFPNAGPQQTPLQGNVCNVEEIDTLKAEPSALQMTACL